MMVQLKRINDTWKQFRRSLLKLQIRRWPIVPILVILTFLLMAIFANLIAPHSPTEQSLPERLIPPAWQAGGSTDHLLGTDVLGRDVLSRIIFGSRVSLLVAFLSLLIGGLGGTLLGVIAGYSGGKLDAVIMRAADSTLAFPMILLALLLAVTLGPSLQNVVIAISITLWARYARAVRGEVLSVKERDFVAQAKIAGCSRFRIIVQHILPNVLNTVVVLLTLQVGWVIIVEATLSFLGAGVPPPTPTWGSMVSDGREYLVAAWWISFLPGIAIVMVVLSFNLMGDWLSEALDPKLREAAVG